MSSQSTGWGRDLTGRDAGSYAYASGGGGEAIGEALAGWGQGLAAVLRQATPSQYQAPSVVVATQSSPLGGLDCVDWASQRS